MTIGVAERGMAEAIGRQEWLEPVDEALGQAVSTAFGSTGPVGRQVQNFLHGTWLGHPLHPVLTDAPIGAWTTALALDALESLTGREEVGPGADAAIGFGLLTAVGAEIVGGTTGLGGQLSVYSSLLKMDFFYAIILLLALMGVSIYVIFYWIGKKWAGWQA